MVVATPEVQYWFWNTSPTQVSPTLPVTSVNTGPDAQRGPFRVAATMDTNPGTDSFKRYLCRDTFARIADGLSNQLMFGEKQIHPDNLGICDNTGKGSYIAGDCTYLTVGQHRTGGVRAMLRWTGSSIQYQPLWLPKELSVAEAPSTGRLSFGSWHPGVCNFVLGDGSVRSFPTTTHPEKVLGPLSIVDDGASVAMPE